MTPRLSWAVSAGLFLAMTVVGCGNMGNGSQACKIQTIRTASLPDGVVGQPYSLNLEHNCLGDELFYNPHWEVSGDLPPGVTFSTAGRFSGTPTLSGSFSLVVSLFVEPVFSINGPSLVDSRTFSLAVRPAP